MCVNLRGFPVYVAHNGLQDRQLHAGTDGSGDEGVAAAVGDHAVPFDFIHQVAPLSFGIIGSSFISPLVAINQEGAAFFDGTFSHFLVCLNTVRADGDNTVLTGFGLAAADEVILSAVDQRDGEQLARPATAGDQDQSDVCSVEVGLLDGLDVFFREDLSGTFLLGHGVQIFGGVGEGDTFLHCPAAQLAQENPEFVTGGFTLTLHLQGDYAGLIVAAEDFTHLHIMELGALLIGQAVILVHALGDLPFVFLVPALVDLGEGHVEFIVNGDVSEPLQGFLCLMPGGVGPNADIVLPGHPRTCAVAGEVGDTASAVGAFPMLPGSRSLPLAAGRAKNSCFREICAAFYAVGHFIPCLSGVNLVS